jgi:hypothetical protein
MKKKHLLLAISFGIAIGLFLSTRVDFEKNNIFKMMSELESCVKQVFIEKEAPVSDEEEGIYQIKDITPSK